jgi:hypothetical protein
MIPGEGDGMAGNHARQGYMLLFGILARPPLMVAGLFASLVIMAGVGKFVGASFLVYFSSTAGGGMTGPITWIAQSVILAGVMIVFAHKIFGLITHLPDKVIRWIGQMNDDLGVGESENRIRGIAMAGGRQAQSIGEATKGKTPPPGPKDKGDGPGPGGGGGGEDKGGGESGAAAKNTEKLSTDD